MFWLMIPCACCGGHPVTPVYHQRTQYPEEAMNYAPNLCQRCREDNDNHWNDMWDDFYRGCM